MNGDVRPTPSWRSRRAQEYQQHRTHHRPPGTGIASTPMRQARLKPAPIGAGSGGVPLALLSSPSRGLDAGTDPSQDLTNHNTQSRFRQYISERLAAHAAAFGGLLHARTGEVFAIPMPSHAKGKANADKLEGKALDSLQQILLLVRRLREGCVAAGRRDAFAVDVYLLSTLCSLLVGDNVQLSSSLARFVDLYETLNRTRLETDSSCAGDWKALKDMQQVVQGDTEVKSPVDMSLDLARSLLLISLSISRGQTERLGSTTISQHAAHPSGRSLAYHTSRQAMAAVSGPHVERSERINAALARDDISALRRLLIETRDNVWQRALLCRVVEEKRSTAWRTMHKAYKHAALDARLLERSSDVHETKGGGHDWLERVLLIDLELMPPTRTEVDGEDEVVQTVRTANRAPPDAWDDSVDSITDGLQAAMLGGEDDPRSVRIRTARLAAIFTAYGLPQDSPLQSTGKVVGLDRWKSRVVMQAGSPVIKLL